MFCVTRARLEMRFRKSPVESSGSFRPLLCADVEEEADQERDSEHKQGGEEHVVGASLQDPEDQEEHADRRQDRPDGIERSRRVGRKRIVEAPAEQDDRRDDQGLEDERRSPADSGRDQTSDQRPAAAPTPPSPLIAPNAQAREVCP